MNRLQWLMANALDVSLNCNGHRGSCLTAAQELEQNANWYADMNDGLEAECAAKNALCTLQIYPNTPVGFVCFQHWDPEVCVERAYRWLRKERGLEPSGDVADVAHPADQDALKARIDAAMGKPVPIADPGPSKYDGEVESETG